jgi:hypothetical protein
MGIKIIQSNAAFDAFCQESVAQAVKRAATLL